jgi:Ca2+/Na+ antiporter
MVERLNISSFLTFVLIFFTIILAGLLGLYLHVAGLTLVGVILLVAFPLFAYFVFRSQEENILSRPARVFSEGWQR